MFTSLSFGAKFVVESFEVRARDMTARTDEVKDVNGDPSALIKVQTDLEDLVFKGGFLVKYQYKGKGEYWVFVQPKTRRFKIRKNGYMPLDYEFGLKAKGSTVYKMKLTGAGEKIENIAVNIITKPTGATIYLDDSNKGSKEKVMTSIGKHQLRIVKEGYQTINKNIEVSAGNTLFKYTLEEIEDAGLEIETRPSGAMVYLDEVRLGKTPISDFYPAGSYKIKITKNKYVTYEDFIEIKAPSTEKTFTLNKNTANLKITSSSESDLEIYINDENSGNKTPYTFKELKPGSYTVKAKSKYHATEEKEIILKRGDNKTINLETKRLNSTLKITSSSESDLEIYLNDENSGNKTPYTFKELKPGTYTIKTKSKYYDTEEKEIILKRGDNKTIEVKSTPIFALLTINTHEKAEVYLNGDKLYSLKNIKLEPQVCNIVVKMRKADELKKRIILKKQENKTLELYPDVKTGKVQISVMPKDAVIEFEEAGGEKYSSVGKKIFKNVPVGTYSLKVSKKGYKTIKQELTVRDGKIIRKSIKLEEGADVDLNKFILVKGGTFQMGSNEESGEKPIHSVTLDDFHIGKYEVTQKEWKEVMGSNPSTFKDNNLPVEKVSWEDCIKYCNKKSEIDGFEKCYSITIDKGLFLDEIAVDCDFTKNGYRLPTEAEWEYAAKGGNKSRGYKYAGSNDISKVAWYGYKKAGKKTHPVGTKQPNELGIYDMSGNVWEWCSDWYDKNYYSNSSSRNPHGPTSGSSRILRGGGWYLNANGCRSALRDDFNPNISAYDIGFRVVLAP